MMHVIVGSPQILRMPKVPLSGTQAPIATELKWESLTSEDISTLASTAPLFGGTQTYKLVGALAGERGDEFLDLAEMFVESPHVFVFEEEKLLKKPTDILTKAGAKVEVTEKKPARERGFDPFNLTRGLGNRDRKSLWLGLTRALRAGEKPEAAAGLMHWKVRDMVAKGSTHYSKPELQQLSRELVSLYHDSHRGAGDLELLLERFALKL